MSKRKENNDTMILKPSVKPEGFLFAFIILSVISVNGVIGYAEQPSLNVKAYKINSIAFSGYQTISEISKTPIIFCAYGTKTKVLYPALKENIIEDSSAIRKRCSEAISQNAVKIAKIQSQNQAVRNYLTADNRIIPLTEDDFLNIVNHPQEYTFQKDASSSRNIAEFRSKEFRLNSDEAFCVYITFVCSPKSGNVEEIVISAVNLESKG